MSEKPLVTGGRVKSMKSKFESLSSLDSLDISVPLINSKPKPFSKFQRSSTSIDLFETSKSKGVNDNQIFGGKSSNIRRQSSDTFLSKLENRTRDVTKVKPLNEIKENVEQISRLSRHSSDPVKRSSIRRSPAFRVGEKPIKAVASKISKPVPEEDVPEKIDKFLKRSVDEKFLQPGITDTLKAALKQPLPPGPPPKKPPRAFESPKENVSTIKLFEEKILKEKQSNDWKEKTKLLSNNLRMRADIENKSVKTHASPSNFLSCIPCTTPIYDVVVAPSKTIPKIHPSEHIYMEPFGHLNNVVTKKQQCSATPDIIKSSTPPITINDGKSHHSNSIGCACPENHNGNGDLHYLVSVFYFILLVAPFASRKNSQHLHT